MTEKYAKACERFIAAFNNREAYPNIVDVGVALGISAQTVKNKAVALRASKVYGPQIVRRSETAIPATERVDKITEPWTPDQCIAELQRLASADPDKQISRNYFRLNAVIADSVWSAHFGTFNEFRRQASLELTRQQHAIERHVAKHASVDHYRRANEERRNYGDKYLRPNSSRFKTIVIASDLHDEEMDPFFRRVLLDTIRRVDPDVFCLGGDGFDLPEFGKYSVDPREWGPVRRIKVMHKFLEDMRETQPDMQIDWLEGNHELRLLRHLSDETPALKAVLSELHEMTIPKLLGLDTYQVNYIAKADLAVFTERDLKKQLGRNYTIYHDCLLVHHFPEGRNLGLPGVNGHHHKHISWPHFSPVYGAYEWHQLGCGHKRDASYCSGEKWHMGFMIANIDTWTRQVNFDYVPVTDFAVSGGVWYRREKKEEVTPETRIALPLTSKTRFAGDMYR